MTTEIRSVADVPRIDGDAFKPPMRTLTNFTEAERRQCEQQANARPRIPSLPVQLAKTGDWRVLRAEYGKCNKCHTTFHQGEAILWHTGTKLKFHPACCPDKRAATRVRAVRRKKGTTVLFIAAGCSNNHQTDPTQRQMTVAVTDRSGRMLIQKSRHGGSNNIAALWAIQEALAWCAANGVKTAVIRTSSRTAYVWLSTPVDENTRQDVRSFRSDIDALRPKVAFETVVIPIAENLAGPQLERLKAERRHA